MKLHELFTDESKWTQGANAVNSEGEMVHPINPTAVRWCVFGGLTKCGIALEDALRLVDALPKYAQRNIAEWNDHVSFPTIRRLLVKLDI